MNVIGMDRLYGAVYCRRGEREDSSNPRMTFKVREENLLRIQRIISKQLLQVFDKAGVFILAGICFRSRCAWIQALVQTRQVYYECRGCLT